VRPPPPKPPKQRRALSNVGGPVELAGDAATAALLAEALAVPTSQQAEDLARAHVHGFHSFPARMHPLTAQRLVLGFSEPGSRVLDPFCGSGTVLVEARLAGREAVGVDVNPLAVRLSRLKARGVGAEDRARLLAAARQVAEHADARRKAKAGPTKRYGPEDTALFQMHVLLELDGLRAGLDQVADARVRGDLELAFSAILTKVSRRTADTSDRDLARRLAAGYPAKLFVRKVEELVARLAEVADRLAAAPPLAVFEGDARELAEVASGSVALAVTSPPYPGNYDYLAHHAARLRWLRLRADRFDRQEVGARRKLDPLGSRGGRERWGEEIAAALRALRRVLRPDGRAVLLLADSVVAGVPIYAVDLIRSAAPAEGFAVRAVASQERPHFHAPSAAAFARGPRREHALLVVRAAS
jgi:SAM-dependent methyltransferase